MEQIQRTIIQNGRKYTINMTVKYGESWILMDSIEVDFKTLMLKASAWSFRLRIVD